MSWLLESKDIYKSVGDFYSYVRLLGGVKQGETEKVWLCMTHSAA